jgi:hypothetical protein
MKDCFSSDPKETKKEIFWSRDLKSLVTFVYLSDRLWYIDRDRTNQNYFRVHNASANEQRE